MKAQLSPEASAVQDAIQRITELCKAWDATCRILTDPAIDAKSGMFHFAVKIGDLTMLNSPSPLRAAEILAMSPDQLWKSITHWSGDRVERPASDPTQAA
jgi:hypothetical protein